MSKIFLAISTQNEVENIKELTSSYYNFDGIAAVDHFSTDGTFELLESRKNNGFVIQIPYFSQHSHDLNTILLHPKIDQDSWILLRDSSERINDNFSKNIRQFVDILEKNNVNTVSNYSKILLFKRFPNQLFVGTPHWGLHGARGGFLKIEETGWFENEEDYCYSVRNKNRDEWHFIWHYAKYAFNSLDSNHCLLGFEKSPNLYKQQESLRLQFRRYLETNNYLPLQKDKLIWILKNKIDECGYIVNNFKILNDFYRYYILNRKDFKDDHNISDMIKV